MVASRFYRHFSRTFGVSLLVGTLISSCGGGEKKIDLGPKRPPRDNAAVANPPPPPKVDPLIPGFTIPAPRFRMPAEQGQGYFQPMPTQHDLVMAPQGTRTIDSSIAVLPHRLPPSAVVPGHRRPSRQHVELQQAPITGNEPKTASEAAALLPQTLPIQPGFQSRPIDPNHPALRPKKKKKKTFFSKLRGIFRKEKVEPKRMPGEQGHILQGNVTLTTPERPQGFSELNNVAVELPVNEDAAVEVLHEGAIDAVVEEVSRQEEIVPEGIKIPTSPQAEIMAMPPSVEKEITPEAWLAKEMEAATQKDPPLEMKEEQREFKVLLDEMQPEEKIVPTALPMDSIYQKKQENSDEGKSIIELIEERRRQQYQPKALDNKSNITWKPEAPVLKIEKPMQEKPTVNWETDPNATKLEDNMLPWLDEISDQKNNFKGSEIPLSDADLEEAEILVEFDIDENGALVDASDKEATADATMLRQQVVSDADLDSLK